MHINVESFNADNMKQLYPGFHTIAMSRDFRDPIFHRRAMPLPENGAKTSKRHIEEK